MNRKDREEFTEFRAEFSDFKNEINSELKPIKSFIKALTDTGIWFLRIIGTAVVLYFVHSAIERYDIGSSHINHDQHDNPSKEVVK